MSSNEDEYNDFDNGSSSVQTSKKRRIQRACDICRRKKIRCDGVQMPGNKCSNCIAYSFDCTYVEAARKRGPPKGYVESLENRLEKMEKLLRRIMPDADFTKELGANFDRETWSFDKPTASQSTTAQYLSALPKAPSLNKFQPESPGQIATSAIRRIGDDPEIGYDEQDDDTAHLALVDNFKKMTVGTADYRFFGKSSGAMLIKTAIDLKQEYSNEPMQEVHTFPGFLPLKRPEFWNVRSWEKSVSEPERPVYIFPEDDLIFDLIDLYFLHVNIYLPLLHRPTFERQVRERFHVDNDTFGAVLLLVCAVASRWSNDARVFLEGTNSTHSCGWKWFDQVQLVRRSLLQPPSLYDLQFYCLSVQYLQGTSVPQACWTMVGIGIRLAQDVGAHRRRVSNSPMTVEDELWKRAFWVLVCMDRMISSLLGRPCAIQDEDFDLEPPLECDDEYWEHPDPALAFKQPLGKPSLATCFALHLNLMQLLAFSLRTIYSINKSKILLGFVGVQWEQHIVAELDSALNKWIDSVPDHLRWDPNRENEIFFNQSVTLYSSYYHLQILIHRPFIPSPKKPSPLSFPSLAICTNAARSCSHIIDIQRRRYGTPMPNTEMATFTAGIVLLLNIWGGKRSGLSTDPNREMADVHKCMQALRVCEDRWHSSGRLWDILAELASVSDLPLPKQSPTPTHKRGRDDDNVPSPQISDKSGTPSSQGREPNGDSVRNIAGSRRVSKSQPPNIVSAGQPPASHLFSLPMYTDELGRLPLHGQVNFSTQPAAPSAVSDPSGNNFWLGNQNPSQVSPHMADMGYSSLSEGAAFDFSPGYGMFGGNGYRSNGDVGMMAPGTDSVPSQQQFDNDTIAMWSNAPTGFELDDWSTYLSEMTHGIQHHEGGSEVAGPSNDVL